jgi:hypothetical protein
MFSLHEVKHYDEQVHVLESASRWIDAPWCMVDKPLSYDRYAKCAVGLREEAQVNFDAIWTHVDVVVQSAEYQEKMEQVLLQGEPMYPDESDTTVDEFDDEPVHVWRPPTPPRAPIPKKAPPIVAAALAARRTLAVAKQHAGNKRARSSTEDGVPEWVDASNQVV